MSLTFPPPIPGQHLWKVAYLYPTRHFGFLEIVVVKKKRGGWWSYTFIDQADRPAHVYTGRIGSFGQ